ncbi:MAG: 4Fe-4S dicluster domain-containing protein [Acidimicrobiia bacterium]
MAALDALFDALRAKGLRIIGPTVRDGAVVYDDVSSVADLPRGWGDEQDGGRYRLHRRDDDALFGYAVGPTSWKRFLFPPRSRLFQADRTDDGFVVAEEQPEQPRFAFLGVRACELDAIAIQDRVFLGDAHMDAIYAARRADALFIAVHCADPSGTCFCVSMGTGPRATSGFDLALTELVDDDRHDFVVEAGSERGADLLATLSHREATASELAASEWVTTRAAAAMGREMDSDGIVGLLERNLEHPRWDDVAARCLACANCTLACPTCFCHDVEDVTDLTGDHAERWRRWDSCFTLDHSYLHGGSVRSSTKARYRQWLTHKLGTWYEQFGSSGCVGCGRCITWCPVGIDLTEEVRAIRSRDGAVTRREEAPT